MAKAAAFAFDDAGTFNDNLTAFIAHLRHLDTRLGDALALALPPLSVAALNNPQILNSLLAALGAAVTVPSSAPSRPLTQAIPATFVLAAPAPPAPHWFLEAVEIEGVRGINNEGSPLVLKFKHDCVNSVSAPNGVGKSSIYDALSYALTGGIPKLDRLLQTERGQEYYLNRFHPADTGSVKLTLQPDNGRDAVTITVVRSAAGIRTVTGPVGVDANALLADLNREFVLLDAGTFQSFMEVKALDRGRTFSGLLGLARYSSLRQELQALSNTRSFNAHFDVSSHTAAKAAADRSIKTSKAAIATDFQILVKEALDPTLQSDAAQIRCHAALGSIPLLTPHCAGKSFKEVDIEFCIAAVQGAEDGPKRSRLTEIIRLQDQWSRASKPVPSTDDLPLLAAATTARELALQATAGALLNELYKISEEVISADGWPAPTLCPTCDRDDGSSVLQVVQTKLGQYAAADRATTAVATEWTAKGWADLVALETLTLQPGEVPQLRQLSVAGEVGTLSTLEAQVLAVCVTTMRTRATASMALLVAERALIEKELPPSLVAVTTAVETMRRLQTTWKELASAEITAAAEAARAAFLTQIKKFLDSACAAFATAESTMAADRLKNVQPLCRTLFKDIMFSPVVPALHKPDGSEELGIRLAEFWNLRDVSAQALLSESYRNAFAVSVYLAAASLYGGAPSFIVLDDVTSSFDAGHQHHLIEVIRTRFARPLNPTGPQLILLSHDTLLEKLFNKHSNSAGWLHQRLEGNARTAVLPQSGAVNRVRETTLDLLNLGRVDDAAPRIRQYLEYVLHSVIDRCRIPVPMDLAFGDDKRTAGEYLKAIEAAVNLHKRASMLAMDAAQVTNLGLHSTTIVSNFLSHWSSGQTQAYSAPALLGVMRAIDDFQDCFRYAPTLGQPLKFYSSLSRR